jgi:MFS family permease
MVGMAEIPFQKKVPKNLVPVYAFGLFSMGMIDLFVFLISWYAARTLEFSATDVGLIISARGYVALIFSIHCGVLMDRFGTRKVSLFFTAIVIVGAVFFPFMTNFWALFLLQMTVGGAISIVWAGALTLSAQVSRGDAALLGRFSFYARIGTACAPFIAGIVWDFAGGVFAAFVFGVFWALLGFVCLWRTPEQKTSDQIKAERDKVSYVKKSFSFNDALPKISDYVECFALTAIPAVAFTTAAIFVRNSAYNLQTSVYVNFVEDLGFSATKLAILFSASEIGAGIGSLFSGQAMKRFDPRGTLIISTFVGLALILSTPVFASIPNYFGWAIFLSLLLAQFTRGFIQGVSQPVLFAVQAQSVGRDLQGSVVGLRQTVNRLGGIIIPPAAGVAVDYWGYGNGFAATAVGLTAAWLFVVYLGLRTPKIR